MDWQELLAEFRSLGGTAENVAPGSGPYGRGLFAIDPSRPVDLRTPENLLVQSEDVEIRDDQLVAKSSARLGERERAFFDRYQRHFSWGAGVFDQLWQAQRHWHELPLDIMATVRRMSPVNYYRFSAPGNDVCLGSYVRSRAIHYGGSVYIMPMIELANHSSEARGYLLGSGVAIRGIFKGEVLVRYNLGDPWEMTTRFGFADLSWFAHSLPLSMNFHGHQLAIGRNLSEFKVQSGVILPKLAVENGVIMLSFLNLGMRFALRMPKYIFYRLMSKTRVQNTDEIFERIQNYNRINFITLLRQIDNRDGKITLLLKESALNQLEALSACFGTRVLDDEVRESDPLVGA